MKDVKEMLDTMYAGVLSGSTTRLITQPFDVLKVRFELQVEPIKNINDSQYRSIRQAISKIIQDEGFKALWKGHMTGQVLSIVYSSTQFLFYEITVSEFKKRNVNFFASNFISGAFGGVVATLVSFPLDVIKTRIIAQYGNQKSYRSVSNSLLFYGNKSGWKSYYSGLLPTLIQIVPNTGTQFVIFKFIRNYNTQSDLLINDFVIGSIAGITAKVIVHPLDVLKKRLQIQGFVYKTDLKAGKQFVCNNFRDAVLKTWKFEGVYGFYKGLQANLIKAAITTGLSFGLYERTRILVSRLRET